MDEYKLVKATVDDGKEILDLIENTPAKGTLELLYTRRPNAYTSYMDESKNSDIYIVRDKDNKLVFQIAFIVNKYNFENKVIPIGYVGGLKKDPNFKGNLHWIELLKKLDKESLTYHSFFCSILNANGHAKDVLIKKREGWPNFDEICQYETNIFNPKVFTKKKWDNENYTLKKVSKKDMDKVYEFIHKEGDKYNFFPKFKDLSDFKDLKIEDSYILLDKEDKIVAFTALWNQGNFKQYIVKKYHFPLNLLRGLNFITKRIGYISLPKEDETFPFYHLSFFLVKDNDIDIYKTFLYKICCAEKDKSLVIGINNSKIQEEIYNTVKKISFKSTIYYIYFGNKITLKKEPYIECGLL